MSSCSMTLTSGICRGCRDNAGGLKAIYVADYYSVDWDSFRAWEGTSGDPEGTVKGAVKDIQLLTSSERWYKLEPNKYSASWTENINVSVENGTLGYEQVVTGVFGKNSQELRTTIEELSKGDLILILVDANDKMWLIGEKNNGAYLSGGNSASGTALTDLNGWNVTFTCNAKKPALEVIPDTSTSGHIISYLSEADSDCSTSESTAVSTN